MLLIVGVITEETCHPIHRYAKSTNKYIKDCDQNATELIFLLYVD